MMADSHAEIFKRYADALQGYPDMVDHFADLYYALGGDYENVIEMRS